VWVDVDGDRVAFLTGPSTRKARNLDRDPRVAISVVDRDQPFAMAAVRGRAQRVEGDAAWEIIDRIALKYIGAPYPVREDRVVFLVEPDHAWAQAWG
jgi:PPOX class probable F420-dependent enzyme